MRHLVQIRSAQRRVAMRRALARHRPKPPVWSRGEQARDRMRLSDLILALLGLVLIGGVALTASIALIGRGLAP